MLWKVKKENLTKTCLLVWGQGFGDGSYYRDRIYPTSSHAANKICTSRTSISVYG